MSSVGSGSSSQMTSKSLRPLSAAKDRTQQLTDPTEETEED